MRRAIALLCALGVSATGFAARAGSAETAGNERLNRARLRRHPRVLDRLRQGVNR